MPAGDLSRAIAVLHDGIDRGLHLGAQLVVSRHGERMADIAVGESHPGVAMAPDTLLPWFSMTKVLTAIAVARQWEREEITLDDPVAAHIPAFAAQGKEGVTIRHLLTHTAGLRNADLAAAETGTGTWRAWLDAVCAAGRHDGWAPGRRAGYQPRGAFLALAEIVRLIDGRPFHEYVREDVLLPLGLPDAWLWLPEERAASYGGWLGRMYVTGEGRADAAPDLTAPAARPSNGAVGAARDMARVFEALLAGGRPVLSPVTVEAMTARHRVGLRDETFGVPMDFGLGFIVNSWHYQRRPSPYGFGDHASPRAFGHGGSESSIAFADPDHGLVVVLVCNGLPGEKANHERTQAVVNAVYADMGLADDSR